MEIQANYFLQYHLKKDFLHILYEAKKSFPKFDIFCFYI